MEPPETELVPDKPLFAFCCHLSPSLMMAGVCALFFVLCRRRGASACWALFATLTLGLCTLVWIYARATYSEALQTIAMLWLVERTLTNAERPSVAGVAWLAVAAGVLCNSKLVYVLILPFVVAYLLVERRRAGDLASFLRMTPSALAIFGAFAALALWHNHLKTGSLWQSGYAIKDGVFSGDLISGVYGFLLSSGKSVFLYSPPVILGVLGISTAYRRRQSETLFLLSIIVVNVLFNAKFRHWHADYCWGPRHLTAITPLIMLFLFPWLPEALQRGRVALRRFAVAAVLALGLGVQWLGSTFYWDHYIRMLIAVKDETGAAGWFHENLSHGHYIPVFSPIRGHLWMLSHLLRNDPDLDRDAPWKQVVPQPARLDEGWTRMRVDWWALNWFEGPDKAPRFGVLALALFTLATALSTRSLLSQAKKER
jgi:hypothetical protein